ncbi:hypothetical protein ACVWWG_005986 [Bradyrhizobium sp. LB7.2]
MPILMVLACARATHGAATLIAPAPISANVERRLMPGVRVLVIFSLPLSGRRVLIPAGDRLVSVCRRISEGGGDVKPKMNYESEFIKEETAPEIGPKSAQ